MKKHTLTNAQKYKVTMVLKASEKLRDVLDEQDRLEATFVEIQSLRYPFKVTLPSGSSFSLRPKELKKVFEVEIKKGLQDVMTAKEKLHERISLNDMPDDVEEIKDDVKKKKSLVQMVKDYVKGEIK